MGTDLELKSRIILLFCTAVSDNIRYNEVKD